MKFIVIFVALVSLLVTGCNPSNSPSTFLNEKNNTIEFTIEGFSSAIDKDTLLIQSQNRLQVIDLTTKQVVKEIPSSVTMGFAISGDIVVWSDLRNENRSLRDLGDIEKANADIFMYNLKTGEQKQISTDPSAQLYPKIWQNYVIWQDNRNDTTKDYPGKWSLYLYDINTGKEQVVTSTLAAHSTYNIHDFRIVWEDDRNNKATNIVRGGDNLPENNKDIFCLDIKDEKEFPIATGPLMESKPDVYGDYVVWEDRNNGSYNADIVLYDISRKETTNITKDKFDQADPKIFGDNLVWMDERRGTSTNDVFINGQPPNSDIFMYNLKTKTTRSLTGDGPQILPVISANWVVYTLSRQVAPCIQVVKY
ncbi:hypothetical protein ACHOLT_11980 [Desulfitobacterium sp. Sab5]|uniref:hypothetical protein n=1 Tax=Desulfitobacterium nosdiversum TaxID=3375356 RepID=UPI003CF40278